MAVCDEIADSTVESGFADFCCVEIDADGWPPAPARRLSAHRDLTLRTLVAQIIVAREPRFAEEISDDQLVGLGEPLRLLAPRALIHLPLEARGDRFGAMLFARTGERRFASADLSRARELAEKVASAVAIERLGARLEAARAEATAIAERTTFLAEATRVLSDSLDYETTLASVARLALPILADYVLVNIVDPGGALRRVHIAHRNAQKEAMMRETDKRYAMNALDPVHAVVQNGLPILIPDIPPAALAITAQSPEHLKVAQALAPLSYMVVPLSARDRTLGTISLAVAIESGRRYDDRDLRLAVELGRRGGMAVDNARLFRDAREAIAAREEFLAIAGHELRTPLTALQIQLQSLMRATAREPVSPEKLGERLGKVSAHAGRLQKLVNELLDVSRIQAGRLDLEPVEGVDIVAVLRDVVARFEDDLADMGNQLTLTVPDKPVLGRWDPERLDHLITNLVANAIKYGAGNPIDVSIDGDGRRARLVVRDRGIGIEHDEQLRIFGRFERAASARRYGGFGLGLWIVHRIVELSGGTIVVESDPGQGATFVISLPLAGGGS